MLRNEFSIKSWACHISKAKQVNTVIKAHLIELEQNDARVYCVLSARGSVNSCYILIAS